MFVRLGCVLRVLVEPANLSSVASQCGGRDCLTLHGRPPFHVRHTARRRRGRSRFRQQRSGLLQGWSSLDTLSSRIQRLYSLTLVLGNTGLINRALHALGIIPENDFLPLIRNEISVAVGLIYFVLPFVIFTLAGSFRRFDRTLEEAAQNLGADEVTTFLHVTLPLLAPGILAAGTLAFVLAGTAFATPLLLGGSAVRMIANVIYDQALFAQNMPVAAALSVLALGFTIACLFVASWIGRWRRHA